MNLQKKLDIIEQYRTCTRFLSHPGRGIDYKVEPITKIKGATVNIEVSHETKKVTAGER